MIHEHITHVYLGIGAFSGGLDVSFGLGRELLQANEFGSSAHHHLSDKRITLLLREDDLVHVDVHLGARDSPFGDREQR